jgi:hypothetical protein
MFVSTERNGAFGTALSLPDESLAGPSRPCALLGDSHK